HGRAASSRPHRVLLRSPRRLYRTVPRRRGGTDSPAPSVRDPFGAREAIRTTRSPRATVDVRPRQGRAVHPATGAVPTARPPVRTCRDGRSRAGPAAALAARGAQLAQLRVDLRGAARAG